MANVYSAIYGDSDFWDGTTEWGYDATSDIHTPTAHANQGARDAQYIAAYTSVAAWEAARDGVAQAANDEFGIVQTPWDSDDTADPTIAGWTTNSITLRAIGDARHSGEWEDGADAAHRLVGGHSGSFLGIGENNTIIDGLQLHQTDNSNTAYLIGTTAAYTGLRFSNNILKCGQNSFGFDFDDAGNEFKIWNNIVYSDNVQGVATIGMFMDSVGTAVLYNNTIYNFNVGIDIDAINTSLTIKNNIIFTNADDVNDAIGATIDYNASDDGDGNNPQSPSGADWANEMSGYVGFDFTLDSAGNCYNNGLTDPGTGLYSDDITGTTRTVSWSIGAFEYDVGAPPTGIVQQSTAYVLRHKKAVDGQLVPGVI